MIAATLVTLALSLGLGQHEPASPPAAAVEQVAPAPEHSAPPAAEAAGPEHGAATHDERAVPGHGEGKHEETLSDELLGHVTDSYTIEYPGVCGSFRWDCEINLKEKLGDKLVFHIGRLTFDMTPSKHLIMMWIASVLLIVAFAIGVRRRNLVPKGLYNFLELLVQFVRDELAAKNIGKRDADRFVPYLATAFFFILFMNLFGLIPYAATATGNIAVTMTMALFTFFITQYAAIKAQGIGGYLKHLTGGVAIWLWPIMIPVEVMGLFTKPFALTIRLFANMIAGHIVILSLLGLIFALRTPFVALGSIPMALLIFALELFVAFVQAYIFTMLSALFISFGLAHHEPEDAHDHGSPAPAGEGQGHGSH